MTLQSAMAEAVRQGHSPGVYRRGKKWRVHLDVATNTWDDLGSMRECEEWLRKKLGGEQP